MATPILTSIKHFLIIALLLMCAGIAVLIALGGNIHLGDNQLAYTLDKEGPHVFIKGEQLEVNYIRGNRDEGFKLEKQLYSQSDAIDLSVYFPLESSEFQFRLDPNISTPPSVYNDDNSIVAISDIESGYKTFRDFLIANRVIDNQLNWIFGQGHLVLVGDFVDRGFSTTQVLWFIYKLEQQAKSVGGHVHFILGNHEIKNLQDNFQKAAFKYLYVANVLGIKEFELYDDNAFLGRWMSSKNSMERINGHLFVHGGIHPQLATTPYTIDDVNRIVRDNYRIPFFPHKEKPMTDWLLSTTEGPSWYRGYFEKPISQQDVEVGLQHFQADDVIVGHTPNWRVKKLYQGKVYAIDMNHPKDYRSSFPPQSSQGLLIKDNQFYRLTADGDAELL